MHVNPISLMCLPSEISTSEGFTGRDRVLLLTSFMMNYNDKKKATGTAFMQSTL